MKAPGDSIRKSTELLNRCIEFEILRRRLVCQTRKRQYGVTARPGSIKVPHDVKLMPHQHPEDRVYTVISGVFYIGLGDRFDADKLQAYPPGSVIVLPGNTSYFHWASGINHAHLLNSHCGA